MAVWSQVKVCGRRLSLQPIGCAPALSVTYSAAAAVFYAFALQLLCRISLCRCSIHFGSRSTRSDTTAIRVPTTVDVETAPCASSGRAAATACASVPKATTRRPTRPPASPTAPAPSSPVRRRTAASRSGGVAMASTTAVTAPTNRLTAGRTCAGSRSSSSVRCPPRRRSTASRHSRSATARRSATTRPTSVTAPRTRAFRASSSVAADPDHGVFRRRWSATGVPTVRMGRMRRAVRSMCVRGTSSSVTISTAFRTCGGAMVMMTVETRPMRMAPPLTARRPPVQTVT